MVITEDLTSGDMNKSYYAYIQKHNSSNKSW